jgi:AcrR family transcriptional regulator
MSIAEPKDRSAAALRAALRARILDAARRIVMRDGLNALSMRKIAEAIGYSPASLYLHFESRDEIARALGREGFAQLLAHLEPIAQIADAGERLRALAHAYVAFGRAHPQAYRLIFMEQGEQASPPDQGEALPCEEATRVAGLFAGTLEALAAAGHLRRGAFGVSGADEGAALLARALWAMLHGVVAFSLIGPTFTGINAEQSASEAALALIVDAALDGWLDAPAAAREDAQRNALPSADAAQQTQAGAT